MTKKEFMRELENKLRVIPMYERIDAIGYYEDYFAEAGIMDDMLVPDSVGTPECIAKQIIDELTGKNVKESYIDENANIKGRTENVPYYKQRNYSFNDKKNTGGSYYNGTMGHESRQSNHQYNNINNAEVPRGGDNTNQIIAIVLLIVLSPLWIGIAASIIGILFSILAVLGSLVFAFVVAGGALIVSAFFTKGIAGGILLAGCGLVSIALAVITFIPLVLYCSKFLPWLVKESVNLCKRLFGRKEQV